ncbi:hypothetical protein I302_104936 [Kwoniella bestiolae CBS 10118]|uniref:Xylanolytic transcriptional activator regulatory domain-containing protein n=1 Tax=Kwoniella bestiolae CBS 10118 TaxID=1296100 RepID=A0A1B9FRC0_9TREE|nr:hypothetical protein I302_08994 [Kwoniella bestiolae CBS 10118]OCF21320.1 hypothetical protein I302_08994 [Kwoniella bestiolae CBS 10118]
MAGTFPTGSELAISDPIPRADFSTGRDVHNPLLFLAECARRGWDSADDSEWRDTMVVPTPSTNIPLEDAIRLGRWSKENLGKIIADQRKYFQHGLHGTKRDVSIGLDPVYQNVIKEDQVGTLFSNYFCHVHSQWGMLDRNVHTPSFVRSRSAFLFTVILALGATSIATLSTSTPQDRLLAIKLWAHLEKLQLVICATSAKSIEIVQGMLMAQMWALRTPRLVDDQRATRLGMAARMAGQIGLQLARHHGNSSGEPRSANDLRTRLSLVLVESRWESIADRQEISCAGFDLTDFEAEELDRTGPFDDIALMAADYALYRFEAESKDRISRISQNNRSSTALDSERIWIQTYLSSWESKWVEPQNDPLRRWWFRYLSIRSRLVGILRVAKARAQPGPWTDQMKADLVHVSIELLEGCLSHERSMHMLRPTSPIVFAAAILLQLTNKDAPERDLILRVALRLSGEPKQEDIMTYAVHNGYQILNMLCLSKEVTTSNVGPSTTSSSNITYPQSSISPSTQSLMGEDLSLHPPHLQPVSSIHQRIDPLPFSAPSNPQPFDDIGQLLGLGGNANTEFLQRQSIAPTSTPSGCMQNQNQSTNVNTVWGNFLSTEPSNLNQSPSIDLPAQTGYMAWPNNGEELFNLAGGGQMSDNDISDFYFHLASALGS